VVPIPVTEVVISIVETCIITNSSNIIIVISEVVELINGRLPEAVEVSAAVVVVVVVVVEEEEVVIMLAAITIIRRVRLAISAAAAVAVVAERIATFLG
jgi:hypothetical protein